MIVIRYCSVNPLYAKKFDGDKKKNAENKQFWRMLR